MGSCTTSEARARRNRKGKRETSSKRKAARKPRAVCCESYGGSMKLGRSMIGTQYVQREVVQLVCGNDEME